MKVVINRKGIDAFTRQLSLSGSQLEKVVEESAPAIGSAVSNIIMNAIIEEAPNESFGAFMAARTKIEYRYAGGTLVLVVSGATEGEAGYPPKSGGDVSGSTNLWARHEFGASYDSTTGTLSYSKDTGGINVQREGRAASVSSPHKGYIKKTIEGLRGQIESSALVMAAITAGSATASVVSAASSNKILIDPSASASLKRAGINESLLASIGASQVKVTPKGQILVMGQGPTGAATFIGNKNFGIPTSIHR